MLIAQGSSEAALICALEEGILDPLRRTIAIENALRLRVGDLAYRIAALANAGGTRRALLGVQIIAIASTQANRAAGAVMFSIQRCGEEPI